MGVESVNPRNGPEFKLCQSAYIDDDYDSALLLFLLDKSTVAAELNGSAGADCMPPLVAALVLASWMLWLPCSA